MLRKMLFVVFIAAFTFAACGRQVTPNRVSSPSGLAAGFMQVKFSAAQPLDFTNVQYVMMFNTMGSGGMPYTNGYLNNYANYSFAIVVGGNGVQAQPQVWQYVRQPGVGGGSIAVPTQIQYTAQQLIFSPLGTNQFAITFDRRLFNGINVGSPSPSPSPPANIWYINWFTTNNAGQPIDAPGIGGPKDTSFTFPTSGTPGVDVTTSFDSQWTANAGWPQVSPQSAQIIAGEVINNGATPGP
ncbi:MAG TPA: hypothetical protein VGR69_11110 [Candidatus Rubrimentiphilum sp.]|nr:hypothetical protein [Candidatus Rubrimentiphilum sp.]